MVRLSLVDASFVALFQRCVVLPGIELSSIPQRQRKNVAQHQASYRRVETLARKNSERKHAAV